MWYRDVAPEDAPLLAALGCPQTEPGDRVRIAMLRDTPAGMVATRRLDGDEGALLHLAEKDERICAVTSTAAAGWRRSFWARRSARCVPGAQSTCACFAR